jgi:hypothetical protein
MVYSPRFEEYLGRLEDEIFLEKAQSYQQFAMMIINHSGKRWVDSEKQKKALDDGAIRRGFDITLPHYVKKSQYHLWYRAKTEFRTGKPPFKGKVKWRHETVIVRGKSQARYRDLSNGRFIKKPI